MRLNLYPSVSALVASAFVWRPSFKPRRVAVTAGGPAGKPLLLVEGAKSDAIIVLSPKAGRYERQVAEDLEKYIELMTGAALPITRSKEAVDGAGAIEISRY